MSTPITQLTDDEIWEELLHSEASRKFLAEQVRKAEEILNNGFTTETNRLVLCHLKYL